MNDVSFGGYLELQIPEKAEFYPDLIRLNTGRNALEYILRVKKFKTIYLPYFTCEVMLEPVRKAGVELRYYRINADLDPILDFEIEDDACFLYTNYFGLKQKTVDRLALTLKHLIIDNSQAFFSRPLHGVDTFYSCRKFFGVSDGAYLSLNSDKRLHLKNDSSAERFLHLIKSIDLGKEMGFVDYVDNTQALVNNSIKKMSMLTRRILCGIDYEECRERRNSNFLFIHSHLASMNELVLNFPSTDAPMAYPFLIFHPGLKEKLIEHKIFVPTYWPNVFEWTAPGTFEYYLAQNLIALPIDHRYDLDQMRDMLQILNRLL